MIASIHIEIDDETGEVMMTSAGDGLALELANEIIELAVNGGIRVFPAYGGMGANDMFLTSLV